MLEWLAGYNFSLLLRWAARGVDRRGFRWRIRDMLREGTGVRSKRNFRALLAKLNTARNKRLAFGTQVTRTAGALIETGGHQRG